MVEYIKVTGTVESYAMDCQVPAKVIVDDKGFLVRVKWQVTSTDFLEHEGDFWQVGVHINRIEPEISSDHSILKRGLRMFL